MAVLVAAAVTIGVCDEVRTLVGAGILSDGLLDEAAHLATGVLVVSALARGSRSLVAAVLASSVLIDLDHVPQYLGADWLTHGTVRPYPHCLLTLVVVAALAAPRSRLRPLALGALLGLAAHFFRDLAEPNSGIALLWPVSRETFSLPYAAYAALMLLLLVSALVSRQRRA